MTEIKTYRDLKIWQKAMRLVEEIYRISQNFPKEENYGITSQIRRAAVSIPSNIAEGYGRYSTPEYTRFLQIALGSLFELQTQIEITANLDYLKKPLFEKTYTATRELERMMTSLIKKLKK